MKNTLIVMILAGILLSNAEASPEALSHYRVRELIRVLSPTSFECRLQNYQPAPFVRFRVLLEHAGPRPSVSLTKTALTETLKSANKIELHNIVFRNYFRIEADLWIDGEPYWVRKDESEHFPSGNMPVSPKPLSRNLLPHAHSQVRPAVPPKSPVRRVVSISTLLDTAVDCSVLTDETPLDEALTVLSASVDPPLPLVILWKDLESTALIQKDKTIGVSGLGRLKLRRALKIILHSVTASGGEPKLALVAEGGILKLGTRQTLYRDRETRVYDVTDLKAVPSLPGFYGQNGRGSTSGGHRPL